jgi:uncharacterized protein (DUF927 family)
VATTFAAPNLRDLGLNSFGFNFSGTTTGGKTLCLRMAASGAGLNSGKGLATWDGTPTGFEQRAMGHRDCIMPLDDISHLEGDTKSVSKLRAWPINWQTRRRQICAARRAKARLDLTGRTSCFTAP